MPTFATRFLVIDTETTGIDTERDRICELGAVYFEGRKFLERRRMLIKPGVPIPEQASCVHGITDAIVAGKPTFAEIAGRVVEHFDGTALGGDPPLLAGYNAVAFDVPILNAELHRAGQDTRIVESRVIDPVVFVRWHLRHLRKRTLEAVSEYYGIRLDNAHSAAADAEATGELLLAMVADNFIPDDVVQALAEQARIIPLLEEEARLWTYWLYCDRKDGRLRMGAGKHIGELLEDVDGDYVGFLLHKIDDLPDEVRQEFVRICSAG